MMPQLPWERAAIIILIAAGLVFLVLMGLSWPDSPQAALHHHLGATFTIDPDGQAVFFDRLRTCLFAWLGLVSLGSALSVMNRVRRR